MPRCGIAWEWGFSVFNPILDYGRDPRAGTGALPSGKTFGHGAHVKVDHPCPKPLGDWMCWLNKVSLEGETVIDPFVGSGTTLVAAQRLQRKAIGIELERNTAKIL